MQPITWKRIIANALTFGLTIKYMMLFMILSSHKVTYGLNNSNTRLSPVFCSTNAFLFCFPSSACNFYSHPFKFKCQSKTFCVKHICPMKSQRIMKHAQCWRNSNPTETMLTGGNLQNTSMFTRTCRQH